MGRPKEQMIGRIFGEWRVLEEIEERGPNGVIYYLCECSCGRRSELQGTALRAGLTSKCRKCAGVIRRGEKTYQPSYNRLPQGEAQFNALYSAYRKKAYSRNLTFNLSREAFRELTGGNCFYCGCPPSQVSKSKHTYGEYVYNGVDRVDNTQGYTEDNSVSCCKTCNRAKDTMSAEDFLRWVGCVYAHSNTKHAKEDNPHDKYDYNFKVGGTD